MTTPNSAREAAKELWRQGFTDLDGHEKNLTTEATISIEEAAIIIEDETHVGVKEEALRLIVQKTSNPVIGKKGTLALLRLSEIAEIAKATVREPGDD